MNEEETEIVFEQEETTNPIKNLWNDITFYSTLAWYITKGYFMWFVSMGGVEIDVGYTEDGEDKNYLHLEQLW